MDQPPKPEMSRVNWEYAWLGMLYLFPGELLRVTEDHKGVSPLPQLDQSPAHINEKPLLGLHGNGVCVFSSGPISRGHWRRGL